MDGRSRETAQSSSFNESDDDNEGINQIEGEGESERNIVFGNCIVFEIETMGEGG